MSYAVTNRQAFNVYMAKRLLHKIVFFPHLLWLILWQVTRIERHHTLLNTYIHIDRLNDKQTARKTSRRRNKQNPFRTWPWWLVCKEGRLIDGPSNFCVPLSICDQSGLDNKMTRKMHRQTDKIAHRDKETGTNCLVSDYDRSTARKTDGPSNSLSFYRRPIEVGKQSRSGAGPSV